MMMNTIEENQIDKLLDDIASIKGVIADNKPLIRQMLLPIHFRIITLLAGISIIGLSALYYFLLDQYGSYDLIPSSMRKISLGLVVFAYLTVVVLKRVLWIKSLQKIDSSYTFGKLLKSIYSYQLLHIWTPLMIGTVLLSFYFYYIEQPRFIVTAVAFGLGLVYNSIGSLTRITQYMIVGYWMIVSSVLPLLFVDVSALIFLALSLGCPMLIFVLISGTSKQEQE
jgi:hypothetical protein